jgi:hypothetical protein
MRAAILVLVALAVVPNGVAEAAPPPLLSSSPALTPRYAAGTPDYTVRCSPDTPVTVNVAAQDGTSVGVDGAAPAGGSFETQVPLEPGQSFSFDVGKGGLVRHHLVRCLPAGFPRWSVRRHGRPEVGWIVFSPDVRASGTAASAPYGVIADSHGVPVWWMLGQSAIPVNTQVLPDGSVAWARLGGPFSATVYDRVALDGTALGTLSTVGMGADHHDIQQLANGDYLMIAYVPRPHVDLRAIGGPADATVFDGEIQEITPDGDLVWSWSTKGHVRVRETAVPLKAALTTYKGAPAYDLFHMNSIDLESGSVLVSGRHVDAIYSVRRSDGAIEWKLGGTHRAESLDFRKDRRASLDGQHDARRLPDGTISVFDNRTFHGGPPRVVRYRIDTRRRTATLLEQLKDRRVKSSSCCGSGRRLSGGDWLVGWGGKPVIEELTPRGRSVLRLKMADDLFSYRAQPVSATLLSRAELHAGMDAQFPR